MENRQLDEKTIMEVLNMHDPFGLSAFRTLGNVYGAEAGIIAKNLCSVKNPEQMYIIVCAAFSHPEGAIYGRPVCKDISDELYSLLQK